MLPSRIERESSSSGNLTAQNHVNMEEPQQVGVSLFPQVVLPDDSGDRKQAQGMFKNLFECITRFFQSFKSGESQSQDFAKGFQDCSVMIGGFIKLFGDKAYHVGRIVKIFVESVIRSVSCSMFSLLNGSKNVLIRLVSSLSTHLNLLTKQLAEVSKKVVNVIVNLTITLTAYALMVAAITTTVILLFACPPIGVCAYVLIMFLTVWCYACYVDEDSDSDTSSLSS